VFVRAASRDGSRSGVGARERSTGRALTHSSPGVTQW